MNQKTFIPVAEPALVGREREYVLDCIESNWISSAGSYVERFEAAFAEFCDVKHAAACSNGTVALHLALRALELDEGEEVIVPSLTFVATANAVAYCGATPVFADSDAGTWNMDVAHVESLVTPRTRGIIAVHLFGLPADMHGLRSVADRHGLFLVEDAAEAHGARYHGRAAGSLGDVATFSFYGNKILTTGEGGMVTTGDAGIDAKIRRLKGQGMDPDRRYWFPQMGYNYRLTNVAAAIGLAQLERADWHLGRRAEIAAGYRELLGHEPQVRFQAVPKDHVHANWMTSVVLEGVDERQRDAAMAHLLEHGVETRPFFPPMHRLPMYARGNSISLPIAESLSERGLSLPSGAMLGAEQQVRVSSTLLDALRLHA